MSIFGVAFEPATLIAFGGWLVTAAGWFVSQRNQRRLFLHQVKNAARDEIVTALRARQNVLSTQSRAILYVHMNSRHLDVVKCEEAIGRYRSTRNDDVRWITLLEEYQSVFPRTASCRGKLTVRNYDLREDVDRFFRLLREPGDWPLALEEARLLMGRLNDESFLLEDLLVYIQNETLGDVFGTTVPFRTPDDQRTVRIIVDSAGNLELQTHTQ